jgi:hypothetical protein
LSKELDSKLLSVLKEIGGYQYNTPMEFSVDVLEEKLKVCVMDISHSLNNLQRNGSIRIFFGLPGEANKLEILKAE